MATALPVYSPREVVVSWGGYLFEGFSSDGIITMAYSTDLTTESVGADGKLATTVTPDRTGTITVELQQNSRTTQVLSAVLAAQNNQPNTANIAKLPFVVSDPSGAVIAVGRGAYLKTAPEISLSAESGSHEWTFYCEVIDYLPVPSGIPTLAKGEIQTAAKDLLDKIGLGGSILP